MIQVPFGPSEVMLVKKKKLPKLSLNSQQVSTQLSRERTQDSGLQLKLQLIMLHLQLASCWMVFKVCTQTQVWITKNFARFEQEGQVHTRQTYPLKTLLANFVTQCSMVCFCLGLQLKKRAPTPDAIGSRKTIAAKLQKHRESQSVSFIHCKDKKTTAPKKQPHQHTHTYTHMYTDTLKVCVCVCMRERERERASQAYIREVEKAEDEAQERKGPRDDEEHVRDECHNVAVAHCTVVVDECTTGQHQHRHGWPSPHYHITSCTHFICYLSLTPSLNSPHLFLFSFSFSCSRA